MKDLQAERRAACSDRVPTILARYGVTGPAAAMCGLTRIVAQGRHYEPHADGEPAIIVPVLVEDELIDLLAYDPRRPDLWHLRRGDAFMLGEPDLLDQLLGGKTRVSRTPHSWLQGGMEGVCPLEWPRTAHILLNAYNGVVGEDAAHGREIARHLDEARTPVPKVFVPREGVT